MREFERSKAAGSQAQDDTDEKGRQKVNWLLGESHWVSAPGAKVSALDEGLRLLEREAVSSQKRSITRYLSAKHLMASTSSMVASRCSARASARASARRSGAELDGGGGEEMRTDPSSLVGDFYRIPAVKFVLRLVVRFSFMLHY